jgi:hypothetical protein
MNTKENKLVKELRGGGAPASGNPSFQGSQNYGFGAKKQLVMPLNPATQAIENQEQDEHNRNIQNLDHVNHTGSGNRSKPGYIGERGDHPESAPNLPGNYRDGTIEAPELHVPQERPRDTDPYLIDDLVNGMIESMSIKEFQIGAGGMNKSLNLPELDDDVEPIEPADQSAGTGSGILVAPQDHIPDEMPQDSEMENVYELMEGGKRHNMRYDSGPPSSAQVSRKFKMAKAVLLDLTQAMLTTDNTEDMGEINHMVGSLQRIEKNLVFTEQQQEVHEDVKVDVQTHIVDKIMEKIERELNKNGK